MKENIVTVIGSLNFDIIFKQQRLAQKGETIIADSSFFAGGGKGANQAVQCAKLGVTTYLVGALGKDAFGDYLVKQLVTYGVNTEYVQRTDENTGLGVVNSLLDGTLVATISNGANYTMSKNRIDEVESLLIRSKIVILQLEIPVDVVEHIIHRAAMHDCFIVLNAAPAVRISDEALAKVNCLVVNEPEASFYCDEEIYDLGSAEKNAKNYLKKLKTS